jgi:hypothetical protein
MKRRALASDDRARPALVALRKDRTRHAAVASDGEPAACER